MSTHPPDVEPVETTPPPDVEPVETTSPPDAELAQRAADGRFVRIDHQQVSFTGTSLIQGELDLVDALDLEKALQTGAEQLKALGSEDSLDVRRSVALGQLARGDQALPDVEPVETRPDGAPQPPSRQIVLHPTTAGGGGSAQADPTRDDAHPVIAYEHNQPERSGAAGAHLLHR